VLSLCYEENLRIYLEQNPENDKKTDIKNVSKKVKIKLEMYATLHIKKLKYYALFTSSF